MQNEYKISESERIIDCRITASEASLLSRLRQTSHGKFIVHKFNGLLVRVEKYDSNLIKPDDKITLELI